VTGKVKRYTKRQLSRERRARELEERRDARAQRARDKQADRDDRFARAVFAGTSGEDELT
jgi:hypothetical protein